MQAIEHHNESKSRGSVTFFSVPLAYFILHLWLPLGQDPLALTCSLCSGISDWQWGRSPSRRGSQQRSYHRSSGIHNHNEMACRTHEFHPFGKPKLERSTTKALQLHKAPSRQLDTAQHHNESGFIECLGKSEAISRWHCILHKKSLELVK